jgi:hypothetical protein
MVIPGDWFFLKCEVSLYLTVCPGRDGGRSNQSAETNPNPETLNPDTLNLRTYTQKPEP